MNGHDKDADCTPDAVGICTTCSVWHGEPCLECGARAYHKAGCRYLEAVQAAAWLVHHIGPAGRVLAAAEQGSAT